MLILFAIGCEGNTAVEEHFQIGPHIFYMLFSGDLQHAYEHAEHPRWHTRDVGHIAFQTFVGNAVALDFKVGKQGRLLLGYAEEVGNRVDVLDEDGAEVTHERAFHVVVGRVTATEDERLAVKKPAAGVVAKIDGDHVRTTFIVDVVQSVGRNRDELRLVVGGS